MRSVTDVNKAWVHRDIEWGLTVHCVPAPELGRASHKSNRRQIENKQKEAVFLAAYGKFFDSIILHRFEKWVGKFIGKKSITSCKFNQTL